ncbi:MAG: hypothetical protein RLZZ361_976 [Cyanobacteriota bacterium]|jgi:predicted transcriptional regulator YheO
MIKKQSLPEEFLNRQYDRHDVCLFPLFEPIFNTLKQKFGVKDLTFLINASQDTKVSLSELLIALFKDVNPFKNVPNNLNNFISKLYTKSLHIQKLPKDQSKILKKYFSKGAFNEFRTKLALFYLKSANIIKDFVQVPSDSTLDHKGFDFLIQKKGNNGSDSIMALQVKSSDHSVNKFNGEKKSKSEKFSRKHEKRVRSHSLHNSHGSNYYKPSKTLKTGILCINAGKKSLPDIANQIKSAIESPNTRSIPVSAFSEDTSQWLDTLIQTFPKKTTQAG